MSISAVAMADSDRAGTVTATTLNLRSEPTVESESCEMVPDGETVLVTSAEEEGWYSVYVDGQTGYMSADYLDVTRNASDMMLTGTVVIDGTAVRTYPSTSAEIFGTYDIDSIITMTGVFGSWYTVECSDGSTGYVRSNNILLEGMETPLEFAEADSASSEGEAAVADAVNYLGVPYVYGGTSPSGFDCSGFMCYIYGNLGYSLNRTAADQMSNGIEVAYEDLAPGDLVFFANGGGGSVGHVGMYISDGEFIHASSGSGQIMIADLSDSYFASYYCGARRIAY